MAENPRPIYEVPLHDKIWVQKTVTPTKTAGSHLLSGHSKFIKINWQILATFLGMSAKLQKVTGFIVPVRPSICMEQFGSHWVDFL